ncbi:MAG: TIM barrel protein [Candidatus Lokiarchaeota archaeon]|nr:TIM barrel protein [Candidatus Lokiarchaeota archaeon]MBD3337818.1 TIM barrel protein [Candidatus Lokiarchaeota archaeon]
MKLSIVSGLNESKGSQEKIIKKFTDLCDFLKNLNYDGIELSLLEPEKINVDLINEVKDSYELDISALGTGGTFIRYGYSLGHKEENMRLKAISRVEEYIKFAKKVDARVIIGLIRGRYGIDSSPKTEKVNILSSLKACCKIAEDNGVLLVFEPINSFEIDSFNTISDAVALLEELNFNGFKLLIDSFHTYLEEDPGFVWDYLDEIAHHVGHIHLADDTRRAPGSGHFDFKTFLTIFKSAGYNDYASIETIMKPSFEDVAKESSEYLRMII